ncbi:hypothetical protein DFH11DRAFT_222905 [Phellopilus nigrolimitatus]|nr:hypothetical protein DFH11DRAFT_222905 [Phellopilus nigrolimitatus]
MCGVEASVRGNLDCRHPPADTARSALLRLSSTLELAVLDNSGARHSTATASEAIKKYTQFFNNFEAGCPSGISLSNLSVHRRPSLNAATRRAAHQASPTPSSLRPVNNWAPAVIPIPNGHLNSPVSILQVAFRRNSPANRFQSSYFRHLPSLRIAPTYNIIACLCFHGTSPMTRGAVSRGNLDLSTQLAELIPQELRFSHNSVDPLSLSEPTSLSLPRLTLLFQSAPCL